MIWRKPLSQTCETVTIGVLAICGADVGAEIAVHRLPHRVVVGNAKPVLTIPAAGTSVARIGRGQIEELDAAVAHLRQQVGVGAELVGREELISSRPPVASRMRSMRLLRADVDRMGRVLPGRELVGELGRRGGPGQDAASGTPRRPPAWSGG